MALWQNLGMTTSALPPSVLNAPVPFQEAAAVFSVLHSEKRRKILLALAAGTGMSASQLAPVVGRSQDGTLKHLIELREAKMVRMSPDPVDYRRRLYVLTEAVQVIRSEQGLELDFGCCVWRVR
jgi:DNA-binding transcriptional ArsR family regulator